MNSDVMPSRVQMEPILLKQLVAEVKETIATGVEMPEASKNASFKAIDLWNIQKRAKYVNGGANRKRKSILSVSHVSF